MTKFQKVISNGLFLGFFSKSGPNGWHARGCAAENAWHGLICNSHCQPPWDRN